MCDIYNTIEISPHPDSFMKVLKLYIILIFLILFTSASYGEKSKDSIGTPVELELFSGVGSILLVWELSSVTNVDSIIIYRRNSINLPFEKIAVVPPAQNRYNDVSVNERKRYFYCIKTMTGDGKQIHSSIETPPFSRSMYVKETILLKSIFDKDLNVRIFDDIVFVLLQNDIYRIDPSLNMEELNAVCKLVMQKKIGLHPWIKTPLLRNILHFDWMDSQSIQSELVYNLKAYLLKLSPTYRNQLLFTPDEWSELVKAKLNHLQKRLLDLSDKIKSDYDYLTQLPPITFIGQSENASMLLDITLLLLNPEEIEDKKLILQYGNEHRKIIIPDEIQSGDIITEQIPSHWQQVDLVLSEQVIQNMPIVPINSNTVMLTLDGEYYFLKSRDISFIPSLTRHGYWLNEIVVLPENKIISFEIAGKSKTITDYGIFINDSLVWETTTLPAFELKYHHASISVKNDKEFLWIHLQFRNENDDWELIESRPCLPEAHSIQSRVPDGESWKNVAFSTLGEKNEAGKTISNQTIIPEVFVLYQNYPNPFNGETGIKFDLIQPVTISLYISDASGRIIQNLIEEEPFEVGSFSFSWHGGNHSSGIYFATITAQVNGYIPLVFSRKMIYLK